MCSIIKMLLILGFFSGCTSAIIAKTTTFQRFGSNKRSSSTVVEKLNDVSSSECRIRCSELNACSEYSYNADLLSCEIIERAVWSDVYITAQGWNLFIKFEPLSMEMINPCLYANCADDTVCVGYSTPLIIPKTDNVYKRFSRYGHICMKHQWLKDQKEKGLTHCYMQHFPNYELPGPYKASALDTKWTDALVNLLEPDEEVLGLSCKFDGKLSNVPYCAAKRESIYTSDESLIPNNEVMHWSPFCIAPNY